MANVNVDVDKEVCQTKYHKEETRYRGRMKKRKWEERNKEECVNPEMKQSRTEPFERIKRKMVVMVLGYSGANYFGMQRNPGMKTIEEDFFIALLKADYIPEEYFDQIQMLNFQRACRTDRGVSAARQIVSIKMPNEVDIEKINKELPPQIRVFALKRVTRGFNSKSNCDARTYIYVLPTYAFENHNSMIVDFKSFRIQESVIERVNKILKLYIGTKNFHNFTSRKQYTDPSSKRYIINMECGAPFVSNGMEFVVISVKGQSFMLHQIRKMVGLTIAIARDLTNEDTIKLACTNAKVRLPMAPGLGLVLDQVHYDRYNKRYGNDGIHQPLEWDEVKNEIDAFKEKFIFPNIINTEVEQLSMAEWLATLSFFKYKPDEDETGLEEEESIQTGIDDDDDDIKKKFEKKPNNKDNDTDECLNTADGSFNVNIKKSEESSEKS